MASAKHSTEQSVLTRSRQNDENVVHPFVHPDAAKALYLEAKDWEGDVCDIANMAGLASQVIEDGLGKQHMSEGMYFLSPDRVERMLFSVYHLEAMINRYRERYFAAIEAA